MTTETIDIVVRESGAQGAAQNIAQVGEAAGVSDKALSELLTRAGTSSGALQSLTNVSNGAYKSLAQTATGATDAARGLLSTGNEALSASSRLAQVGAASQEAAAGMTRAGTAGTALVLSMREAAAASQLAATAETEVGAAGARAAVGIASAGTAATAAGTKVAHLGEESEVLQNKLERLELTLVALGLALGIKELIQLTDTYANMGNQLDRVKVNAADFAAKQNDVLRIAQASRQPLETINELYVNMSMALRNASFNATQVSQVVQTLATAATVSGKSVSETSSALQRLGISLRQGEVNGRGFLQFLVQMPEIGEKVAEALGFIGTHGFQAFVKAANAGAISTQRFIEKIIEIGPQMTKEMKQMEVTVASAFVVVKNAFLDYIGRSDQVSGASQRIAQAVLALAAHIPVVVGIIGTITIALTAYGVAVGTAALATGALAFSFAGIIGIIAALVAAIGFFGDQVKLSADGTVTAFSLVVGIIKTVIEWAGKLYTWMTTTTEGLQFVTGAAIALAGALGRLIVVTVVGWIASFAAALASIIVAVAPVVLAIAGLVAAILAIRYAWIAATQGIAAANADLGKLKDNVIALGTSMKDSLLKNIQDANGGIKKAFGDSTTSVDGLGHSIQDNLIPTIVRGGQASSGSFKSLADDANGASIQVVNGFNRMGTHIIQVADTAHDTATKLNTSTIDMGNSVRTLESAAASGATAIQSDFNEISASANAMASTVASDVAKAVAGMSSLGSSVNAISKASASGGSFGAGAGLGNYSPSAGYSNTSSIDTNNLGGAYSPFSTSPTAGFSSPSSTSFGGSNSSTPTDLAFATGGGFTVGGSGGTDSQMVKFLATPGERVTVETPGQARSRKSGGDGGNSPIIVKMTVNATDANSFRLNETQLTAQLVNKLRRVQSQLGG